MTISVLLFVTRGGKEPLQLILLVIDTSYYYLHDMIHYLAGTLGRKHVFSDQPISWPFPMVGQKMTVNRLLVMTKAKLIFARS